MVGGAPTVASVPDNLITPDSSSSENSGSDSVISGGSVNAVTFASSDVSHISASNAEKAATVNLYNKQPQENIPFNVGNMFPGDSETKYFRVRVSYHDKVTVHYKAAVRRGFEKLAEVVNVRVKLLTTGDTMYDGLMKDMPESLTYKLTSEKSTVDELYYEITAYLDTAVGNEYQDKGLIADFKWWVEESENLDNVPKTGDFSNIMMWSVIAICAGCAVIFLLIIRRHKGEEENG